MAPLPPARPALRSVVFDLDGLLIDSEPIFHEVGRTLLGRRGKPLTPELIQAMMGTPARQSLEIFRQHHRLADSLDSLMTESWQLFFELWDRQPAPLLPGVLQLLERLERAGIPKGLATSSSAQYVERVLGPYQLQPRFAFVLSSDDVVLGKPYPEVYQKAAARLGHAPGEMLVLEDSVNGLRAAKAAGACCIVVPHALVPRAELALADAIADSLAAPIIHQHLGLDSSPPVNRTSTFPQTDAR